MPYSESFGFITNLEDESGNNVIDAVIAHEMAHQWWAHQEIPAKMQGATFLTESFSEYSSLMVMKEAADDDPIKMKNFLKYDFNRYLRGRSREREKELPLYKVENQTYIHYGKGAVVLYALQDYIGEDSVNAALKSFLEEYRYAEPPYPNSHDFLRHLNPRVPDSLKYLVEDMVKNIRLYDLRLTDAQTTAQNGGYITTFKLAAKKFDADSLGNETEINFDDWIDIGLYADSDEEELLVTERVQINQNDSVFTLFSKEMPKKAAIDPKRLLIERVTDDNVKTIELVDSAE
jgi:aminopeptidase N